ncbi:MAG: RNA 2',3'-cyclic phosphodiesterase [Bacteroidales bacterium]
MTKRLFAGFQIIPEPTLITYFSALQQELKNERIKWVEPHNMHITLWFFGDTDAADISLISKQLQTASQGISPFDVTIKGCGTYGRSKNPSVIWMGLEIPEMLKQLYGQIHHNLSEIGIQAEHNEYRPHLTLGRIKGISNPGRLTSILGSMRDMKFQVTKVNGYHLYESRLFPAGPVYTQIETFNF